MTGPLALVGSGEYLPIMLEVERSLLVGQPSVYVQIPTGASTEGPARLAHWVELGRRQAERLGVESRPVVVVDRADADDPAMAAAMEGAGLIYLSGGKPAHLADTLRGTAVWAAIEAAWIAGAALAGCSAGAMAMCGEVPDILRRASGGRLGFGIVPTLRVIPHFDRNLGRLPDIARRLAVGSPADVTVVGIDEDTALIWRDGAWTVAGRQAVWLLDGDGRAPHRAGATVDLPPPVTG